DVSLQITELLEQFTDLVEVFSVDEQFMDLTPVMKYWGESHRVLAERIQDASMEETGVYARVGMARNKVLAKVACDNFAKKNKTGISQLEEAKQIWPLPVGAMFGVGGRMEHHFRRMGIRTIGHLAN